MTFTKLKLSTTLNVYADKLSINPLSYNIQGLKGITNGGSLEIESTVPLIIKHSGFL